VLYQGEGTASPYLPLDSFVSILGPFCLTTVILPARPLPFLDHAFALLHVVFAFFSRLDVGRLPVVRSQYLSARVGCPGRT
jgi:hypothetical protein